MIGSLPSRTLPTFGRRTPSLLEVAAAILRSASFVLARLSRTLSARARAPSGYRAEQVLEFYAEAGAPEGALYIDGQLIGHLPGVTRL